MKLRHYAVRFFLTRPLTAFVGFALCAQARSTYALRKSATVDIPTPLLSMLAALGFAAGVVAFAVLIAPSMTHRPPSVKPRQWMGWVMVAYFLVRGAASVSHASKVATGPLSWIDNASGLWGWSLVGAFGVLMIVAPSTRHLWGEDLCHQDSNKQTYGHG